MASTPDITVNVRIDPDFVASLGRAAEAFAEFAREMEKLQATLAKREVVIDDRALKDPPDTSWVTEVDGGRLA